jgi:hypothetical protein
MKLIKFNNYELTLIKIGLKEIKKKTKEKDINKDIDKLIKNLEDL